MNTRFRNALVLASALGAVALSSVAAAGTGGMVGELAREAKEQRQERSAPPPQAQTQPQRQPEQRSQPRGNGGGAVGNTYRGAAGGGARVENRGRVEDRGRGDNRNWADNRGGDRGVIGGTIQRNYGNAPGRPGVGHRPPPRYVDRLPGGYRQYQWRGSPYYHYGNSWYRPYGNRYVVVGAPYGLFVGYLPGYYSSFWFGGSRYFYADDTYYLYDNDRRGYVVTRSPYDSDRDDEEYSDAQDEDLYIYPARGQSEQQQADDRYECHSWAEKETGYDPIDSEYDAGRRAEYLRAMSACLTGRGYSVK